MGIYNTSQLITKLWAMHRLLFFFINIVLKKKLCVTIHKGIRIEIEFKEISNNIEQKFAFQMKRKFVFSKLQNCEPETFQI